MEKVKINGLKLELYDSIEELPICRFNLFNKYALIDAGIGSDVNSIANHVDRAAAFVTKGDYQAVKTELHNLKQSLLFTIEEVNPKQLSFIPFIKSINGKELGALTDDKCTEISKQINEVKKGFFDKLLSRLKKKSSRN